uniref:Uncharacterized protein n=1 Tax=Utricularia reniformis TaxID=192314 RepID=A0A1Y0AYY4_9LAMI|nr:hypothetical protein AEK19_MT1232 [Utricularia reniformis]ART30358.1 hypothetical protein AEK19_MT1232 [Utricularia reniformis]
MVCSGCVDVFSYYKISEIVDSRSRNSSLFIFQTRRIGIWPRCDLSLSLVVLELWFDLARRDQREQIIILPFEYQLFIS